MTNIPLEKPLETIRLDDQNDALVIIDQTLLPNQVKYLHLKELADVREAIYELRVRGAPAIGIAAGYGAYLAMKNSEAKQYADFYSEFQTVKETLATARPTAVNLIWALDRLDNTIQTHNHSPIEKIKQVLLEEADSILAEDLLTNKAIGENGLSLLNPLDGILTHCNAGALATGGYGTATAPIYLGQERGYNFKVFADETRPLLQGARLTTFELARAGVDVTLICDNMAATVMQNGWIQAVLVGCDRVAANGDTANKIGTAGVAILAKYFKVPFYVCAPSSTIDPQTSYGTGIEIEQRQPDEIYKKWYSKVMAPESGVNFFNPAFDVTPADLITAFITEKGIFRPPYDFS